MDPQMEQGGVKAGKGKSDRIVKLIFVLVAGGLAAGLWLWHGRGGNILPDWREGDLSGALAQAAREKRPLLVLFMSSPPDEATREMAHTTLRKAHNVQAVAEGRFLRVKVSLDTSLDSDLARRYRIRKLPTMVILSPDGKELNRREGFIGETQFRDGFLDLKQVIQAP